jgi:hypothetical protein
MTFITDPKKIPSIPFYEITVEEMEEGDYHVSAKNLEVGVAIVVNEVTIGNGTVGRGEFVIEEAAIRLDYSDNTLDVTFA